MDNRKNGLLDCVIVGGCGHVGLPLALSFADVGCRVGIHDIDTEKIAQVKSGTMPFLERGAEELLRKLLQTGRLEFSDQVDMVGRSDIVVTVIGTPIDEFMNPSMRLFERVVDQLAPHLRNGSLLVLRSTVYPGTTEYVETRLRDRGVTVEVAFCPERIAEGYALEENRTLPQVIGVHTDAAFERAATFFQKLDVEVIRTTTEEAEMAKLMTNTWRYMKFAIANQFFQIAHSAGLDYSRILHAVRHNYPRAADLPGPGFAAGPCLLKDTMQLAAYSPDHFPMGHSAMLVNEGLPAYIIDMLDHRQPLAGQTVGILGMAFKGESDDPRSSLSYKLKKLAGFKGAHVLCTDPYVSDPELVPLEKVLEGANPLIIGAPHRAYQNLAVDGRTVVDIWGILGQGIRL
ncbi:MAG: nucleotide sugar dehydrogenase [Chloroflexi bacterium]|nr:MAG: nucleotide sugar dehydrogenase [Chloroflexota bacterium]TMG42015.1 MAG: nucleotide sugar dehydrogenase [Chloroflexota bacterium]